MDVNASNLTEDPTTYHGSIEAFRSSVNLFTLPETDVSTLKSGELQPFFPQVSLKENFNPVDFIITSDNSSYIDLSESYLAITARIVRQDGAKCIATDKVAPCSLFFHAMFSNAEVYLNGMYLLLRSSSVLFNNEFQLNI